ncbi:MAG: L-seryl-tRNA(Sec) selenium transferase [Fibrobacterota bacterium]
MHPKREIPQVSRLITHAGFSGLATTYSRESAVNALREELDALRESPAPVSDDAILAAAAQRLARYSTLGLRRVVNATGTLVHTNLGRAVLPARVHAAVAESLAGYCNLEYDLESGGRGKRAVHAEAKLRHLTGAEACLVVNNNAAAVMLAINTFALGKDVVVSRGELVEIGGSFRLPDIIAQSGGILREVGTTNKTRFSDYEKAVGKNTGLLLKIHPSNYTVTGFTETVSLKELAALSKKKKVPFLHDAGSGLLADSEQWGFDSEPDPRASIKQGSGLVSMSGDKLLGGPQAGILLGKKRLIDAMKKNPMMRALRLGKLPLVALEAALIPFLRPDRLKDEIPLFAQLSHTPQELEASARSLADTIRATCPAYQVKVEPVPGSMGGGSLPEKALPSYAVTLSLSGISAQEMAKRFRTAEPPVIGTFYKGNFALNVISLLPGEAELVVKATAAALAG